MTRDYKEMVRDRVFATEYFVRTVFSGRLRGHELSWSRVVVRPIVVKGAFRMQFSYFDEEKSVIKNYSGQSCRDKLDELLELPFRNIHVQLHENFLEIRIGKKGQILVYEGKSTELNPPVDLAHDRKKTRILPPDDPIPFLEVVGIMTGDGKVKANMQRKFRQINEFLRIVEDTGVFRDPDQKTVHVVDFGCGNAYLTFAIYHYLNSILNRTAYVTGVDIKSDLLAEHREKATVLGWERLTFQTSRIVDFQAEANPDMILALHACDTATDDALAQGIRRGSKIILVAPCCHHELQKQLRNAPISESFALVMRHGILYERLGDILTDALRAAILRIAGYRTDVIQFVSTEHTARNLMIRAIKVYAPGDSHLLEEYWALKEFWGVTPYLEHLLTEEYSGFLQRRG